MRWEKLFADVEAQLAAQRQRVLEGEAAEEAALLRSSQRMVERLMAHRGRGLRIGLTTGRAWEGRLADVGSGWCVLEVEVQQVLVPLASVQWWEPEVRSAVVLSEARARTLGLALALRALAHRREPVRVHYGGPGHESDALGLLRHVGADFLEIEESGPDPSSRTGAPRTRIFPLDAVVAVSSPRWVRGA